MNTLPNEYGPLVRELLKRAAARRQPAYGTFELTSRCNLSCSMCYVNRPAGDTSIKNKELSSDSWILLAREAADSGMVFLLLTGGEVFLRSDFFQIYEPLTRMGLILTIFTNGTLISDAIADRLSQSPPNRVEISLYGASASTYEAVTGVRGSYKRCCKGIEALIKRQIPLGLKTIITTRNVNELSAMKEMAKAWGVSFISSWLLSKRSDGQPSDVENLRLAAADCVTIQVSEKTLANSWEEAALLESSDNKDKNFYCLAGKAAFVISPSGKMNVCLDLPLPAAQPLEVGFEAAWNEVQRFTDAAPPPSTACIACDSRIYCGRCPAWSYLETGTLTEPVPYWCEIAHQRKIYYSNNG
ncbi:MAG: radical SAM protein [Deltaproteobacteria bacterium]|nr:radical SAM protein [Deltaproteobacteria bacterium]